MIKEVKNFLSRFFYYAKAMNVWNDIASYYDIFVPPAVLSKDDLKNYEDWLKKLSGLKRVLILGVTPQIRNLFSDFQGEVVLADFSKMMHESTKSRVSEDIRSKEKFIRINWLNLNKAITSRSIDLILGDFVLLQIRPEDREHFLNTISDTLKPDGLFITRVKIHNPAWSNIDPLEILRKDKIDYYPPLKQALNPYLLFRFGDKILNLKDFTFRSRDFIPLLEEALNQSADSKERYYIIDRIRYYERINMVRSYFPKPAIESLINARFKIVDVLYSNDYEESEFFPIYVLQKH